MIFVFGSNLAGRHGKGAALYAATHKGAERGVGEGPTGQSYAIPTKDERLRTRPWSDVCQSIRTFLRYAAQHPSEIFVLTPIGCGLAGFDARNVWGLLKSEGIPNNVALSPHWVNDHDVTLTREGKSDD